MTIPGLRIKARDGSNLAFDLLEDQKLRIAWAKGHEPIDPVSGHLIPPVTLYVVEDAWEIDAILEWASRAIQARRDAREAELRKLRLEVWRRAGTLFRDLEDRRTFRADDTAGVAPVPEDLVRARALVELLETPGVIPDPNPEDPAP